MDKNGVSSYGLEIDGVFWIASRDPDGRVVCSPAGGNEEGKTLHEVPSEFMDKADRHLKGGKTEKADSGKEEGIGKLEVTTHADGTLSTNIPESSMTDRQKEFVEICRKSMEAQNAANTAGKNKADIDKADIDKGITGNANRQSWKGLKDDLKKFSNQIREDYKTFKETLGRPVEDLKKGWKVLLEGGGVRELKDRIALRIHDNLLAMGVLPKKIEENIKSGNAQIEERLGYTRDKPRKANPNPMLRRIQNLKSTTSQLGSRRNNQNTRQNNNNNNAHVALNLAGGR